MLHTEAIYRERRARAFSVIELMVAITIMGAIVYMLFSVFNKTQGALRASEVQGDVSEKARAIMEMVSRELEQAQPSGVGLDVGMGYMQEVNLMSGAEHPPRVQKAAGRPDIMPRTNVLNNLFFLTHQTNAWAGIGYRVTNVNHGVGVLVRYQVASPPHVDPATNHLFSEFLNEPIGSTNYHHVADGVIHFKITAYDENGYRYNWYQTNNLRTNFLVAYPPAGQGVSTLLTATLVPTNEPPRTIFLQQAFPGVRDETRFLFTSNAMPAYLELELAMLEPEALRQFYTMIQDQNPNAEDFLERQIASVHLFRRRIPIRTAAQ